MPESIGAPVGISAESEARLSATNRDRDVTELLVLLEKGNDPGVVDRLFPLVYDELRQLAAGQMKKERADHTLQATALVNEV